MSARDRTSGLEVEARDSGSRTQYANKNNNNNKISKDRIANKSRNPLSRLPFLPSR